MITRHIIIHLLNMMMKDGLRKPILWKALANCGPHKHGVRAFSYYPNGNIKTEIDYEVDEI